MMNALTNARLITALITPFGSSGDIDVPALERVMTHVLATGSEGLVLSGTTGEGSALTLDEKKLLFTTAKRLTKAIPLIAATGTHSTRTTIELSKAMIEVGCDALLVVSPYYVKPSQEGLFQHFKALAEAVAPMPIIIYNIPGRTSVTMSPETMGHLATGFSNIIGVKQSLTDMDVISEIRQLCPPDFIIWSGDDSMTLPMMSLGAKGVISVASHLFGREILAMIEAFSIGDIQQAQAIHHKLFPAFRALFTHPNPMDVKACLHELGMISPALRLPLVSVNEDEKASLKLLFEAIKQIKQ